MPHARQKKTAGSNCLCHTRYMDLLTVALAVLLALVLGAFIGFRLGRNGSGSAEHLKDENSQLKADLAAATSARDILAQRVENLEERASQDADVLQALAPVKTQLASMEKSVRDMETQRAEQYGSVAEALKTSAQTQEALREATGTLAGALRSSSARGTWGEAQLRRVVEAAGMENHVAFTEQASTTATSAKDVDAAVRPDMLVYLPGGKVIVLDAKAPLAAYLSSQDTDDADEKLQMLTQHAKAVKAHVDALAGKKYWNGFEHSPELVLCFIPIESALSAALLADASLLDYAASKNIALVSPVSLLASLKAIAFSWRQDALTDNAKELFQLSTQLYERLGTAGGHLANMGRQLTRTVETYNGLVGSLESRVFTIARKIAEIDGAALTTDALSPETLDIAPKPLTSPELIASAERALFKEKDAAPEQEDPDATRVLSSPVDEAAAAFAQYQSTMQTSMDVEQTQLAFDLAPDWEAEVDDEEPAVITERPTFTNRNDESPFDYDSWNN